MVATFSLQTAYLHERAPAAGQCELCAARWPADGLPAAAVTAPAGAAARGTRPAPTSACSVQRGASVTQGFDVEHLTTAQQWAVPHNEQHAWSTASEREIFGLESCTWMQAATHSGLATAQPVTAASMLLSCTVSFQGLPATSTSCWSPSICRHSTEAQDLLEGARLATGTTTQVQLFWSAFVASQHR